MNASNLYCSRFTYTTEFETQSLSNLPFQDYRKFYSMKWDYVRSWLYANSLYMLMAVSSLSSREGTRWLAVVTASERQSPCTSTPDEVQPPITGWKLSKSGNSPIRTCDGQKMVLHTPIQHIVFFSLWSWDGYWRLLVVGGWMDGWGVKGLRSGAPHGNHQPLVVVIPPSTFKIRWYGGLNFGIELNFIAPSAQALKLWQHVTNMWL